MKKNYIFIIFAFSLIFSYSHAQTYLMSNSTISTCSGTFYDTGGNGGNYLDYETYTMTFCSSTPGLQIRFVFSSFSTESCCDHLSIYDGPNTGSPLIGTYQGTTGPGTVTSSSGCLTFVWTSDLSIESTGWAATISCLTVVPTCSDGIQNQGETPPRQPLADDQHPLQVLGRTGNPGLSDIAQRPAR